MKNNKIERRMFFNSPLLIYACNLDNIYKPKQHRENNKIALIKPIKKHHIKMPIL